MRGSGLTAHGLDFVGDEPKLDLDELLHRPHECFGRPQPPGWRLGGMGGGWGGLWECRRRPTAPQRPSRFK